MVTIYTGKTRWGFEQIWLKQTIQIPKELYEKYKEIEYLVNLPERFRIYELSFEKTYHAALSILYEKYDESDVEELVSKLKSDLNTILDIIESEYLRIKVYKT